MTWDLAVHVVSILVCLCTELVIDSSVLNLTCISGMKPVWTWCMIFLMCYWIQFARSFVSFVLSVFIRKIDLALSFLCLAPAFVLEWQCLCGIILVVFFPFLFYGTIWEAWALALLCTFGRAPLWIPLVLEFLLLLGFLLLLEFHWFYFDRSNVPRNLFISSRFFYFFHNTFSIYSPAISCISLESIGTSTFHL